MAATNEGHAKVEFHSGEAENSNAKRTTLTGLGYSLYTTKITSFPDSRCLG